MKKYRDLTERLMANSVETFYPDLPPGVTGPCWDWWGHIDKDGYGRINLRILGLHMQKRAHRVAYEELTGDQLLGNEEIDHKCRNRKCIHPNHLEKVSGLENIARMKRFWRNYFVTGRKQHPVLEREKETA